MRAPSGKQAVSDISELLSELLGIAPNTLRLREAGAGKGYDF